MWRDAINLAHADVLQWLWLLVPVVILFALDMRRRQRVVQLFVSRSLLDDVSPRRSVVRPIVKFGLLAAGLAVLLFALAQPRWDPQQVELEQRGQNLLFLLDVSNSMRAQDVDPSRLGAAKASIRTLINQLPAGNQIGLLAYAGSAELECPLTPHYGHFLSVLQGVSHDSVDLGGSNLGDAIDRAARQVFGLEPAADEDDGEAQDTEDETDDASAAAIVTDQDRTELDAEQLGPDAKSNVMIILTDGENHEGYAREMARQAHAAGVAIYIIGLGTEAGATIPIEVDGQMTTLKFKGEEVITKYDDASLRGILDGLPDRAGYLPAGASNVDLVDVYQRVVSQQEDELKKLRFTVWQEKFQLFVGIGMILVVTSSLISSQKPEARRRSFR